MSKITSKSNLMECWNVLVALDEEQRERVLGIMRGMQGEDVDDGLVEVIGLVMTKKVAPNVFSAIHHACKNGGGSWNKDANRWEFDTEKERDAVLRAQKKYAKEHGFDCALAKA